MGRRVNTRLPEVGLSSEPAQPCTGATRHVLAYAALKVRSLIPSGLPLKRPLQPCEPRLTWVLGHRGVENETKNDGTVGAAAQRHQPLFSLFFSNASTAVRLPRDSMTSLSPHPLWGRGRWVRQAPPPLILAPFCGHLAAVPLPPSAWQERALWLSSQALCRRVPSGCRKHLAELAPFFSALALVCTPDRASRQHNKPSACSCFPAPAALPLWNWLFPDSARNPNA